MSNPLFENTLLFDGSMGTYFYQLCPGEKQSPEYANLSMPEKFASIHQAYIASGAQAIKTNTFSAYPSFLEGNWELSRSLTEAGIRIAQKAAGKDVLVFGDMGPILNSKTAEEEYLFQVDTFLEEGVQYFLLETFPSWEMPVKIAAAIKEKCPEAVVITQFAVNPEGYSQTGVDGQDILNHAEACSAIDAAGFNCLSGPTHLLDYIRRIQGIQKPLSVMPNAGYPTVLHNRTIYQNDPAYFAQKMWEISQSGARILGGCCGTTPEHIRLTAEQLRRNRPIVSGYQTPKTPSPALKKAPSLFEKSTKNGRLIAVEVDPPLDTDVQNFLDSAKALTQAGADFLTIADCPVGRARADSSILSIKLNRELGIPVLPHVTCRDRNLNAIRALLLGLNIEGVRDVLVITGDPIPGVDRGHVKAVFNFNSVMLASYISKLNETIFLGNECSISAALNVNATNFSAELKKAQKKEAAGVTHFFTQPLFSKEALENVKRAKDTLKVQIFGGIMPIVSYKNACFLNSEVPGISVPPAVAEQFRDLSREEAGVLGARLAAEMAQKMRPYTDGDYLITPLKRYDIICSVIQQIKE